MLHLSSAISCLSPVVAPVAAQREDRFGVREDERGRSSGRTAQPPSFAVEADQRREP